MKKGTAVLVAGAPRSGTSAVSGALAAAGVSFGPEEQFVDARRQTHNPIFYERQDINDLNDRILARFGKRFGESFHPDEVAFAAPEMEPLREEAVALVTGVFGQVNLMGLKDPRFCLTAPLWLDALSRAGYEVVPVIVRRAAADSIQSNVSVNEGMGMVAQSRLWVQCNLAAHYFFRDTKYFVALFDDIMAGDMSSIERLLDALGINDAARELARGAFDRGRYHHRASDVPLLEYVRDLDGHFRRGENPVPGEYIQYHRMAELEDGPEHLTVLRGSSADAERRVDDASQAAPPRLQVLVSRSGRFGPREAREARSVTFPASRWETVVVSLGEGSEGATLRVDPVAEQGIVNIGAIAVIRERDDYPVWTVRGDDLADQLVVEGTCWSLRVPGGMRLLCWGADPQILLPPLALREQAGTLRLEISMKFEPGNDAVIRGLRATGAEIRDMHATLAAVRASLSWRWTAPLRWADTVVRHAIRFGRELDGAGVAALLHPRRGMERVRESLFVLRRYGLRTLFWMVRGSLRGAAVNYANWCERNEPDADALNRLRAQERRLGWRPLVSVVMPVYNTEASLLRRAVRSVCDQTYTNWELCIADDGSPAPHVRPLLEELAGEEKRIRVVFREKNGHIAAASNSALEVARGEFIALLDHDDELAPHALQMVVLAVQSQRDAQLVYSDEDKIDEAGQRMDPYFKPDWNPDLLMGQNYVSHLSVLRRSAVEAVGGWRVGYEGSQDWDLVLRVSERCRPEHILHIPHVLYHWRMIAGSTSIGVGQKSYTMVAAEKALRDALARRGVAGCVSQLPGCGYFRTAYTPPNDVMVSIVIPTRDQHAMLRRCMESIYEKTVHPTFEILVMNNGSTEPETKAYFRELDADSRVRVIDYPYPFNYAAINNAAARAARGEFLVLLNNDTEVITEGWLSEMLALGWREGTGAVGARLLYPNGTLQHAGVVLGILGVANHAFYRLPRDVPGYFARARLVSDYSAVTAACLGIRKSIFEEVGGMDEENLPVAFNDIDFCIRVMQAGYRNVFTPFAQLYHHEMVSRGHDRTPQAVARFRREVEFMRERWGPVLDHDPSYSPNLTLVTTDFALAPDSRAEQPWRAEAGT